MDWRGKRVLVTGHTGFKGSWLSLWLQQRGAEVAGVSLGPPTAVNLFENARVGAGMHSMVGDIRDLGVMKQVFAGHRPEVVFHLAAQPLVRTSYQDPLGTYSTNVIGTANILEAARATDSLRAVVVVTTDKCYENREWERPYQETDRLGGFDPYSNSKACAELVVAGYRSSFFHPSSYDQHRVSIATARAGNVIGGGDWADDRLLPDIIRAFIAHRPVRLRNPRAIRPWQHVLEPLRGYLKLAESLYDDGVTDGEAWNFGPEHSDAQPVEWIVRELIEIWGGDARSEIDEAQHPHEAQILKLDCSKAHSRLGWRPVLELKDALTMTAEWYKAKIQSEDMFDFTSTQIKDYEARCQTSPEIKSSGVQA